MTHSTESQPPQHRVAASPSIHSKPKSSALASSRVLATLPPILVSNKTPPDSTPIRIDPNPPRFPKRGGWRAQCVL
ncbi:hypothetical protein ACFX1T_009154 [Malus domestica]